MSNTRLLATAIGVSLMRSITRTALVLACSAALAGGMALSASAADTTTGATVTINGGGLAISAPGAAPFASVSPGANATFALLAIGVTDTRADVVDWTTTASLTNFVGVNVAHIIPAATATYDPSLTATTGDVLVTEAVGAVNLGAPVVVAGATAVTGNNSATWDAALAVAVPSDALGDSYTATLTHSVL